jgi:hypothetical protein
MPGLKLKERRPSQPPPIFSPPLDRRLGSARALACWRWRLAIASFRERQLFRRGRQNPHARRIRSPILSRVAAFDIVWRSFATVAAIGFVSFAVALVRFRRTVAMS